MTRWAGSGHGRGRRGVRSVAKSFVERLCGSPPPRNRPRVEQFGGSPPLSGPTALRGAGIARDGPWQDVLQANPGDVSSFVAASAPSSGTAPQYSFAIDAPTVVASCGGGVPSGDSADAFASQQSA